MISHWNVGIFLFNEVEVLDFAGPFEVFPLQQQVKVNHLQFILLVKMEK